MKERREDLDTKNRDKDITKDTVSPNTVAWVIGYLKCVVCIIAAIKGGQMYMQARTGKQNFLIK